MDIPDFVGITIINYEAYNVFLRDAIQPQKNNNKKSILGQIKIR